VWTTSAPTQDFREAVWTEEVLTGREGRYVGSVRLPASGYAAMFGDLTYAFGDLNFTLSTDVKVASR
jgi:hypothetical protein